MKKLPFFTAAAIAFGLSTSAVANTSSAHSPHECQHRGVQVEHHKPSGRFIEARKKQLEDREFTKSQLETLLHARLIMLGNDNLKLGSIEKDKDGYYRVDIVTQNGSLVSRRVLGKNSLPVSIDGKTKAFGMGLRMLAPAKGQRSDITADEARTLVAARLLIMDNPNLKIGSVKEHKGKGYTVQITTQDGSLVTERFISRDGLRKRVEKVRKQESGGFKGYSHKKPDQVEYNG